jgi:hypothetical protein
MQALFRRLAIGDDTAIAAIVAASSTSDDPTVLVAASFFAPDGEHLLARAERLASIARDRQLVAIAAAHRRGERDVVDALARDHLVDHPDSVLVAWIADVSNRDRPTEDRP